jgi:hypothetical protein
LESRADALGGGLGGGALPGGGAAGEQGFDLAQLFVSAVMTCQAVLTAAWC